VTVLDGTERNRKLRVKNGIFEDLTLVPWGVRIYIW